MQITQRQTGLPAPRKAQTRHSSSARQAGKMLVPLLGVLTVLALGVAAVAIVLQIQEREKRQARERELQIALNENADLKSRLDEAQQSKTRTEEQLAGVRKELSQAKEELQKTLRAQAELTRSVEDREAEIARLTQDLAQARADSQQVSAQLSGLQSERDEVKRKLADLERAKEDLEAKVMELSERPTVELDKVLVTGEEAGEPPAAGADLVIPVSAGSASMAVDGQVVVINREYDFIVMNLGKNHGLSIGQEFQVVRGTEVLGHVKVEKVYDELSAAAILPDSQKQHIREGDAVRAL
jgi:septal ring factor EnvC (AmiA/AmiB activator)